MKGYIYKFENKVNGKIYVGQTTRKVKTRYKEHLRASIKELDQLPIHRAIKKYGIENFIFEIIYEIENDCKEKLIDDLNNLEISYITELNCIVPNGYNVSVGGHNISMTHISREFIIWEDEPVVDIENNIIYEDVYEWLISNNLSIEEQYHLYMDKDYKYRLVNQAKLPYPGECYPENSTIEEILTGKGIAMVKFPVSYDCDGCEEIEKNSNDIALIKKELERIKLENAEMKEKLEAKDKYIV